VESAQRRKKPRSTTGVARSKTEASEVRRRSLRSCTSTINAVPTTNTGGASIQNWSLAT
jgi:hypothetical protein